MRQKACKNCGAVFETDKQGAYLCPACAAEARRKSVYRTRVCIDCGVEFMGFPASKRCPECQLRAKRNQDATFKRNGPARPIGSTDLCEKCGEPYIVGSGNQRYCKSCAAEAVKSNVQRHKREYQTKYSAEHAEEKAANRSFNKVCVICGKVFDTDSATVTCSPECDRQRRKLIQARADKKRSPRPRSAKNTKEVSIMTDKQFLFCVQEAPNYSERDAFISDVCLSSVWDDADADVVSAERIEAISQIWDACHRSMKEIAAAAGLSQRKLAEHFCIPYRTVEDWCAGRRECPVYVRLMMQECLGLISR